MTHTSIFCTVLLALYGPPAILCAWDWIRGKYEDRIAMVESNIKSKLQKALGGKGRAKTKA